MNCAAEVEVAGAIRHVHDRVVSKRIVSVVEIEDALAGCELVRAAKRGAICRVGRVAGGSGDAGATALEEEHHFGWVGLANEERELAAVAAHAVRRSDDLFPLFDGCRGSRSGRSVGNNRSLSRSWRDCRRNSLIGRGIIVAARQRRDEQECDES